MKFEPILKEKIWGGKKLSNYLIKKTPFENTGESWEIWGVRGSISKVANGSLKGKALTELIKSFKGEETH